VYEKKAERHAANTTGQKPVPTVEDRGGTAPYEGTKGRRRETRLGTGSEKRWKYHRGIAGVPIEEKSSQE